MLTTPNNQAFLYFRPFNLKAVPAFKFKQNGGRSECACVSSRLACTNEAGHVQQPPCLRQSCAPHTPLPNLVHAQDAHTLPQPNLVRAQDDARSLQRLYRCIDAVGLRVCREPCTTSVTMQLSDVVPN
jgi:hypothetical protein